MKAREREILTRAIEEGVAMGYQRAGKYVSDGDSPEAEAAKEQIVLEVLNAIDEMFVFDADRGEDTP